MPARRRRRLVLTSALLALLLAVGGALIAVASAPLPPLEPVLTGDADAQVAADTSGAEAAVAGQTLPTAIGWADGDAVWTNDESAYPIASLTKLVTVLVGLEKLPLETGSDGPVYTWTAADRARQAEILAVDGIAYPIPVGTEITLRQMLQLILLPSANDFAAAFAGWAYGDEASFVAAANDWAAAHELSTLTIVEPTGLDEGDRSSAADLVRLARLALQNPTIREITSLRTAELPWGIGVVRNTNPLLGVMTGIVGLKTGSLDVAGYNLIAAREGESAGRGTTSIAVTLARPTPVDRAASGTEMLTLMESLPQQVELVSASERIGTVTTWTGDAVELVAAAASGGTLLPGESAARSTTVAPITAADIADGAGQVPAGTTVGSVAVTAPANAGMTATVDVMTASAIPEPDFWWRLTHPGELFGW